MAGDKMQLEDWLDDLCVRFIINLPEEDLSSVARICFQIEEAQWFYEDFIRPLDPTLPSMTLRNFSLRIFQHCPLLAPFSVENHTRAFEEFLQYKTRVPVRGAILLNDAMDSTVLVKGWKKGANWSFPRGKINKDEDDLECAIREVYEETGYDLHAAGLVPADRNVKYIEITMREQQMRLYVFRNVPVDTPFAPRTRKEISKIEWYRLSELPAFRKKGASNHHPNDAAVAANANKFYMVAPFLVPLKKWVVQQKKRDATKSAELQVPSHALHEEPATEDDTWAQGHTAAQANISPTAPKQMPALDTLEGATKELQRLLKVQPAAVPAVPLEIASDKGASLLAILQASSQASIGASGQISQASLDHVIPSGPQAPRPHQQPHFVPRVAMDGYQVPPSLAFHPTQAQHQAQQAWNQHPPAMQHHPQQNVMATPAHGHIQPPLRHPQPLPPQVHIDRGSFLNTPSPAQHHSVQAFPGPKLVLSGQQDSQHIVVPNQPRPPQLSNHSMALLDVLKSGSAAQQRGQPSNVPSQAPHELPAQVPPQPYTAPSAAWQQSMPVHPGPSNTQPGRVNPVTAQQRATLLDMFNKKAENTAPDGTQMSQAQGGSLKQKQVLTPVNDPVVSRPGPAPNSQESPNPAYRVLQRSENIGSRVSQRPTPLDQTFAGYASHEKPSSLTSPPATSSLPTPAILQRKQSMSHEQRNKLLSLFGKPQPSNPGFAAADDQGNLVPPATTASPHSAGSGPSSHVSDSRRGSQTPISPADRSFLLNYLASATSKAQ